jgi:hypothetical protein
MRVLYPVFTLGSLCVVSLRTVPLLKDPPELRAGDRSFPVEEGPPFELAGLQVWHKAEELAGLGRELVVELAHPEGDGSYQALAPLLADERHARAPLKLLSRFRPPLEGDDGPAVLLGATLTEGGHAPMELTDEEKSELAFWLTSLPAVGLFPRRDADFIRTGAAARQFRRRRRSGGTLPDGAAADGGQGSAPLSGWRAWAALKERGRPPYPVSRSVLELPEESWMKRTAELFGMLPLKWAASGGFFQGSPSSAGWGDVLRAAAPSLDIKGPADGLFPVPVLSGSLLDNAVGAHRAEVFVGEGRPVPSRHVMICGPTGTGKTLLGTFAMLNECVERGIPAVYLGPTRMLVEDAALEFMRLLAAVEREAARPGTVDRADVLLSTGESFYDDGRIAAGDFRAAFIVYEKAGNFFLNTDLTGRLGFVLIDELHMLGDRSRGGALDATLARLVIESRSRLRAGGNPLRIMCLSTGAMAGDRCLLEMMSPPGQESFPGPGFAPLPSSSSQSQSPSPSSSTSPASSASFSPSVPPSGSSSENSSPSSSSFTASSYSSPTPSSASSAEPSAPSSASSAEPSAPSSPSSAERSAPSSPSSAERSAPSSPSSAEPSAPSSPSASASTQLAAASADMRGAGGSPEGVPGGRAAPDGWDPDGKLQAGGAGGTARPAFPGPFPLMHLSISEGIHLPQEIGSEDPDAPDIRDALGQSPSADPAERLSPGFLHNPGLAPPSLVKSSWPSAAFSGHGAPGQGASGTSAGAPAAAGTPYGDPSRASAWPGGVPSGDAPAPASPLVRIPVPGVLAAYPGLQLPGSGQPGTPQGPHGGFGGPGGPAGEATASRADSVYEAARRPDFIAPAGWGPLVLSVFERPQRLLTYIQPTSPVARCRPVHVGRIADPGLGPSDFVLDREAGARFIGSLDGWVPGHEKIIYASYSGVSLTAFARRAVERFGRGRVPSIVEDGFYLRELEASLARTGAREQSARFYLEAASRGVFFHFSGLSRETRRLMADGYRRFSPVPCEPFVLCATETISYGVNLPADALFLENISWPRSRYRNCSAIEALTSNEFRNLVGRVGRYGHIKPGVIPTVVVNWPLGRSVSSPSVFEARRKVLAEIASSSPASEIDCRDLQGHLVRGVPDRLSDYPGPVARFYMLSLLHASKAAGGGAVTAGGAAAFLAETYAVRSLERRAAAGQAPRRGLFQGLSGFLDHLAREFGSLVLEVRGSGKGRRYMPAALCSNLARNGTSPYTLKELDRLLPGLGGGQGGLPPELFGLRALLAAPLLTEMRYVFSRVFTDPRMLSQGMLRKARTDRDEAEAWFRRAAAPVEALLARAGLGPEAARAMCERVRSAGRATVDSHLRENFRRSAQIREVSACLRDTFLQKVLSTVRTLLMWIDGSTVRSILAVAGSGLLAAPSGSEAGADSDPGPEADGNGGAGNCCGGAAGDGGAGTGPRAGHRGTADRGTPPGGAEGRASGGSGTSGDGRETGTEALAQEAGDPSSAPDTGGRPDSGPDAGRDSGREREPGREDGPCEDPDPDSELARDADAWEPRDGAASLWQCSPPARLKGGVDNLSFNQRYCDKTALVIDSYLAYCLAGGAIGEEEALSLQVMSERVRWGLREGDLEPFNRDRKRRGMGREEWLARSGRQGEGGVV